MLILNCLGSCHGRFQQTRFSLSALESFEQVSCLHRILYDQAKILKS